MTDSSRASSPSTPQIRAAVLGGLPAVCAARGIDLAALLAASAIPATALADPDARIPLLKFGELIERAVIASDRADIVLQLSAQVRLVREGPLAVLLGSVPRVSRTLELAARYMRLHNEALHVWMQNEADADGERHVAIGLEYFVGEGSHRSRLTEFSMGVLFASLREMLGEDWTPTAVAFRHAPATARHGFARWFGAPVRFEDSHDAMYCPYRCLLGRNRLATASASGRLDAPAAATSDPDETLREVRRLIWALLPSGACGAQHIAGLLGVHRRTLHRHLAPAGGYASVLGEIREELALRHLAAGRRRLADIADLLGFATQGEFSRWFAGRKGMPPVVWRRRFTAARG